MRWKLLRLSILFSITLWLCVVLPLNALAVNNENARTLTISMSASVANIAATPSTQASKTKAQDGSSDTSFPVAWIGFAGLVVAALIAALFGSLGVAIYQSRRNSKLEREKLAFEQERIRFQARIDEERDEKERQRQRKEQDEADTRTKMQRAQTIAERVQAYREALHADPRIFQLQILAMSHPLSITNVFVRVRLHQEPQLSYELDPLFLSAETLRDPNEWFRVSQKHLESRVSKAVDPDDAIRKFKRCVFVGDPGAGKTTLLKYLALRSADQKLTGLPDLPVYIELNAFATSEYHDLLDFVASRWDDHYGFPKADARDYLEEILKAGNALILLDALDETAIGNTSEEAEASYKRVADAIMQLVTRYHQSYIAVTARKAGYYQHPRLVGFTELEVLDFRPGDIKQFIENWFECSPKQLQNATAVDLNARLSSNVRLQTLAANPLLLSLIVIVYEDQFELPERRAELYKQCIDILLTKWDTSRDIRRRREFKPDHKRQLLEEIAWHFHNQGRRYMPESELLVVIAKFLPVVGLASEQDMRILGEIAAENGLLKEQARHWYGFLHLTLQEYFVALYIVNQQLVEILLEHLGDPWWEEVLLLYAGQTPDASILLQKLLEQDNGVQLRKDLFHTHIVLAGRCLAARPAIRDISLRNVILTRLKQELTRNPYSLIQDQIVKTFAEIGGVEVSSFLVRLLGDPQLDSALRISIAQVLGKLGERAVVPDLLRLINDPQLDSALRISIIQVLGKLREQAVVPDLLRLLNDPQLDSGLRISIAQALGKLGERAVVPDLLRLLNDPQLNSGLRVSIAQALGNLGERTMEITNLVRLLGDPQLNPKLRISIAQVLVTLGERTVAISEYVRLVSDTRLETKQRQLILKTIMKLGERAVVPDLLRLLGDPQLDIAVRRSIIQIFERPGERAVVPDLLRLLGDPQLDIAVRVSIAQTLGRLGERAVVPDLLRLLGDPQLDLALRITLVQDLEKLIDEPMYMQSLASFLESTNIADTIFSALWTISQRMRVRVFLVDGQAGRQVEVVKW